MGYTFVPAAADYPQTNDNRTLNALIQDILEYIGGEDDPDMQSRAMAALNTAVREFNGVLWKFNRLRQDITLTAGRDFSLSANFRAPLAATLLNASNEERERVVWVPFEEFIEYFPDRTGTGTSPMYYTIRNSHETGIVTVEPKLVTPLQYPKMRVEYFRRIERVATENDVLNVPEEVEEALVQRAVSIMLSKARRFEEARDAIAMARAQRMQCEVDWRDWPDF